MIESFALLERLYKLQLLNSVPKWWWPNAGSFEVMVGCVLVQNSKWENVQKSLDSMRSVGILPYLSEDNTQDEELNYRAISNMAQISMQVLSSHIFGLQNQKAQRLILLAQNLLEDFENFRIMRENLSPEWLLRQKGFGRESVDCVLNYMCFREVMVVDRYTHKLLCKLGVEIEDYEELQRFCMQGIEQNLEQVFTLYEYEIPLALVYARFHGKIVEFGKQKGNILALFC